MDQVQSFNPRLPFFCIYDGLVTDRREVKTKEGKPFMFTWTVAAMGDSFEVQTKDVAVWNSIGMGRRGRWLLGVSR